MLIMTWHGIWRVCVYVCVNVYIYAVLVYLCVSIMYIMCVVFILAWYGMVL